MTFEYINILIFIIFSFTLSVILLLISFILTFDTKLDIEKSSAYECGFQPFSEARFQFTVQFSLIAILFLLFDIEILYIFPYALSFLSLPYSSLIYLIIFFVLLLMGLLYEISRGVLNFNMPAPISYNKN